jgi:prolipoprotein diacylglyceryltransferase
MSSYIFVLCLAIVLFFLLAWAFRTLPKERWQIIAAVPVQKTHGGQWIGLNLTFYGLFTASAQTLALIVLFILLGSIGLPTGGIFFLILSLLLLCIPSSWLIAAFVERKRSTFTVGGASFVGLITAPLAIGAFNYYWSETYGFEIPPLPAMAAISVAYLFGEGVGRLACISYGCCYGRPLRETPIMIRRLFRNFSFCFTGKIKKIAYESGLEGVPVVPIQAMTSSLFVICGLLTTLLFLQGRFGLAFGLAICFTHFWRIISETLRADFRGGRKFSTYQRLSLLSIGFAVFLLWILPADEPLYPILLSGLQILWQPAVLLVLQFLWVVLFLVTGNSLVTGSVLDFHVHSDRI